MCLNIFLGVLGAEIDDPEEGKQLSHISGKLRLSISRRIISALLPIHPLPGSWLREFKSHGVGADNW